MKLKYLTLILIVFLLSCNERIIISDTEGLGLKFKVKEMHEQFFTGKNIFDSIVPETLLYTRTYKFDYKCRFTEITRENMPFVKDTTSADSLKCDTPPNLFSVQKFEYIADTACNVYSYDKCGNVLTYQERTYNQHFIEKIITYDSAYALVSKQGYWYDECKRKVNETTFFETSYYETKYTYSTGKKTESYNYNFDNYEHYFDLSGNLVKKNKFTGKKLVSETIYSYNEQGDLIIEKETDNIENVSKGTTYEYTYDSKGNWTVCIERRFDGNIFLRNRVISYYD